MEKTPLPVKIISGIVILVSLALSLYALARMCSATGKLEAVVFFILFACCIGIIASISAPIISNAIGAKAAANTYWPGDRVELLPPDYSGIQSYIVKGDYYKAIDELEDMIKKESDNRIAVALLSDIYVDHIEKFGEAIEVISNFLNRPERSEGDVPFVMKLTDVLLEINEDEKAIRLLEREVTLPYEEKDKNALNKRLNGIEG